MEEPRRPPGGVPRTAPEGALTTVRLDPESLARASSRHPWRTVGAWVVAIAAMGVVSQRLLADVLTQEIAFTNRPESVRAQELQNAAFPDAGSAADSVFFIVSSEDADVEDPGFQATVDELEEALRGLGDDIVAGAPYSYLDARAQAAQLLPQDGRTAVIPLQLVGGAIAAPARIADAASAAAPAGIAVEVLSPIEFAERTGQTEPPPAGTDIPEAFVVIAVLGEDPSVLSSATAAVQAAIADAGGTDLAAAPVSGFDVLAQSTSLISRDGQAALLPLPIAEQSAEVVEALREVAHEVETSETAVQVVGSATLFADFSEVAEEDLRRGEGFGLAFALLVLIVVFAAIVAALLPIVMGLFSIVVALGAVALIGQVVEFNLFVQNMVSMIGLAVGIDYSLFIVSRYREERQRGRDKLDAIGAAGATANRAVFFSGITVVLALLGMFIVPSTIFRSLATGAVIVTLVAIAASMTLLPAFLGLLGDRINWPRFSRRARADASHDPAGGFWDRITRRVMARPVVFLVAATTVMGGLGWFTTELNRGTSQNVTQLPDDFESKAAFITLTEEFAGGAVQPVEIIVTGSVTDAGTGAAIDALRASIAAHPAMAPETVVTPARDGGTVLVEAYFRGDPSSDSAFAAVREMRETLVPEAFAQAPGDVEVLVGGETAFFTDFLSVADDYQGIVLAFVLGLSFLLLTVVFRSIALPIKAILMNLLSVAAAYGAVTLVFQKGVGIGFFNAIGFRFQRTEAIEAWLPLFLFSILFGLSMDYHVFLLTRIREEYDRTGDNAESVAYGLRTTAGIITGAALIMVAVFTAFASGRLGPLQQMGFGLAVAILLDATIVRTILVPASMRLLGDLNWYLPRWLRWLPQVNVEGPARH